MYVGRTLSVGRSSEAKELLSVIFYIEDGQSEDIGPGLDRLNLDDPEDSDIRGQHPLWFRLRDSEGFPMKTSSKHKVWERNVTGLWRKFLSM